MAMLYCYLDESGKKGDHPVVTVSAICISEVRLPLFDADWKNLLRSYEIDHLHMAIASRLSRKVGPKMPRHQSLDKRIDALLPFVECIRKHFDYGFVQAVSISAFEGLSKDIRATLGSLLDPYQVAFMRGLVEVCDRFKNEYVSLICDDDEETALDCYKHYRAVRKAYPRVKEKAVSLTFADDKHFSALQAADMAVFLARLETKSRVYGDRYSFHRLFATLIAQQVGCTQWGVSIYAGKDMKDLSADLERRFGRAK